MSVTARALVRFWLATHVRNHRWLAAFLVFATLLIAGSWAVEPREFFAYGMLTAATVAVQFGFADIQSTGSNRFLLNLVEARTLFISALLAAFLMLVVFATGAAVLALIVWRDAPAALWYATYWLLIIWTVYPLTLLIEVVTGIRFPTAIALLLLASGLVIAYKLDPMRVTAFLGNGPTAGSLRPLGQLLAFNLSWNLIPLLLAYVVWVLRQRLASGP